MKDDGWAARSITRPAERLPCGHNLVYMLANADHRFESFSNDFRTWVIYVYVRPHRIEL